LTRPVPGTLDLKKGDGYAIFFASQLGGNAASGPKPPDLYIEPVNDWLSAAIVTEKVPDELSAVLVHLRS
jgi:hypothetical protein